LPKMDKVRELLLRYLSPGMRAVDIAVKFDINRRTVYKIKKLYDESGGFSMRKRGERPGTVLTRARLEHMKAEALANPTKGINELAKEMAVSPSSVSRGIRMLGGKSLAISKRPLFTRSIKEHHFESKQQDPAILEREGPVLVKEVWPPAALI